MNSDTLLNPGADQRRKIAVPLKTKVIRFLSYITNLLFYAAIALMLYVGWDNRYSNHLTPESGLGYALGIVGGLLMILLLIYPLRKKFSVMRRWGPIKYWFWTHMLFGTLGPALVLLHSNFRLGSINGRVAFFSMLIVAISGFFGRYIYTRIHHGLYGKAIKFNDLKLDSELILRKIGAILNEAPEIRQSLKEYEETVLKLPGAFFPSGIHWVTMRLRAMLLYRSSIRAAHSFLEHEGKRQKWSARKIQSYKKTAKTVLLAHKKATRKLLEFHFWERLFSLWHLLHLPLFLMMIITGFIHVYAVHAY
jgi:hypothetical protein